VVECGRERGDARFGHDEREGGADFGGGADAAGRQQIEQQRFILRHAGVTGGAEGELIARLAIQDRHRHRQMRQRGFDAPADKAGGERAARALAALNRGDPATHRPGGEARAGAKCSDVAVEIGVQEQFPSPGQMPFRLLRVNRN